MANASSRLPPRSECLAGSELALTNAERLLHCSQYLGDHGEFGIGCTLLVLASEEALKALALYTRGIGLAPDDGLKSLLRDHQVRHALALLQTMFLGVFDRWASHMFALEKKFPENERSSPEFQKARKNAGEEFMAEVREMLDPSHHSSFSRRLLWWTSANDLKNRGLYVDFRNGTWSSPSNINQESFDDAMRIAKSFVDDTRSTISLWNSMAHKERSQKIAGLRNVSPKFGGKKS